MYLLSIILPVLVGGQTITAPISSAEENSSINRENPFATVEQIPLPKGFERVEISSNSFASYLRKLPLKKDRTVYLYNGHTKANQDAQFAVIDLSLGTKDLQQCADVVMRLRAEYYYMHQQFDKITFKDNANRSYQFAGGDRKQFDKYLEKVFSYCGTLSLEHSLVRRFRMDKMEIGDVFIKGGSPGHAMIVVDMAINAQGKKLYLLAQGYMPAQQIHVVNNPENGQISPWYIIDNERDINTPEWSFKPSQLKHW